MGSLMRVDKQSEPANMIRALTRSGKLGKKGRKRGGKKGGREPFVSKIRHIAYVHKWLPTPFSVFFCQLLPVFMVSGRRTQHDDGHLLCFVERSPARGNQLTIMRQFAERLTDFVQVKRLPKNGGRTQVAECLLGVTAEVPAHETAAYRRVDLSEISQRLRTVPARHAYVDQNNINRLVIPLVQIGRFLTVGG
jgi:hypothetical protein